MKFATSIVAAIATTGAAFTVIPQKLSHPSQLNALNTMGSISSITAESPKEVLSRVQDAGLTLTNPNDLYWMVDFLKEKYYDNGDYYYPIKTVCDGESIDVKFYCPFEPSLSPHYLELYGSRDERASIYETTMKKYNRINSEKPQRFAPLIPVTFELAKSCDVVVEHAYNKMQAFLKLKEEILESASDEEERLALARMIKTREDSLIGYVLHEVCCVEDGYARDHKPLMKAFLEEEITKSLAEKVKFNPVESESVRLN
eukprot:jgi/Psemu1/323819/estExt_fgenesh1_pg.C_970002